MEMIALAVAVLMGFAIVSIVEKIELHFKKKRRSLYLKKFYEENGDFSNQDKE